jgi:hypothetical protein
MGLINTWIGLTVTVYICLISFTGVEILRGELVQIQGEQNVTLNRIPPQRTLNESTANTSGNWMPFMENLLDTPQSEQEKEGANYQGPTMGATIYNLFIRGTVGFSEFTHNLLHIELGTTASWLIQLAQWFLVVGNALIILQIIGKAMPGIR